MARGAASVTSCLPSLCGFDIVHRDRQSLLGSQTNVHVQAAVLRIFDVKMAEFKMQLLAAWDEDGESVCGASLMHATCPHHHAVHTLSTGLQQPQSWFWCANCRHLRCAGGGGRRVR